MREEETMPARRLAKRVREHLEDTEKLHLATASLRVERHCFRENAKAHRFRTRKFTDAIFLEALRRVEPGKILPTPDGTLR